MASQLFLLATLVLTLNPARIGDWKRLERGRREDEEADEVKVLEDEVERGGLPVVIVEDR